MKKVLLGFAVVGMLLSACQKEDQIMKTDSNQTMNQTVPGQYVVVLKPSTNKSFNSLNYTQKVQFVKEEAKQVVAKYDISEDAVQLAYGTALRGFSAKLSDNELKQLKNDNRIDYIVPDKVFILKKPVPEPPPPTGEDVPYGIARVGTGDGTGKTAWIIDTGIDFDHPDLNVNVSKAAVFTRDKTADDNNGHGSHCAGTVAAIDNEFGVIGVAAGATVVPVKVLDRRGSGYYSWIIAGVDYVAANAASGDAANMSLGGGVYQPIDDAVYAASQKGIYFALAAGNESDDALNHSPARVNGPNIWTVSAMDVNDNFAYFSNYGTPVDFCMPGVSVYSTFKNGGYTTYSGTSMAAPHMCGVLLMTNGHPSTDGYVNNDPDGDADPIGHL
ncbi:MAG: S8 family peptidase [Bacteroidetes bacterium]|nr:MAG: S8 family peptidase [Bacteroidota bacterium]